MIIEIIAVLVLASFLVLIALLMVRETLSCEGLNPIGWVIFAVLIIGAGFTVKHAFDLNVEYDAKVMGAK